MSHLDDIDDHYEAYKKWKGAPKSCFNQMKVIKIHVWSGSESENSPVAGQKYAFDLALAAFAARLKLENDCPPVEIEYRGNNVIRNKKMSPMDMINWLLSGDIHIMLTHPHQGQDPDRKFTLWNIPELHYSLDLLQYHIGFPNGINIRCPVVRQDKYRYLVALEDYALPTLKIILTEDGNYDQLIPLIIW